MAIAGTRKQIETTLNSNLSITFSDILIPLFAGLIFVLLVVFVYIPRISAILEMEAEITDIKEKEASIAANLAKIDEINANSGQLTKDLLTVKYVIPSSLEVANFTYYVDQSAVESGLELVEISSGDIEIDQIKEQAFPSGLLKGVTGPLQYHGSYEQIVDFLNVIKAESPYILETSEISLSKDTETNAQWTLNLTITGFYMTEVNNYRIDPLKQFNPYTSNLETMLLLEEKSLQLKPAPDLSPSDQ